MSLRLFAALFLAGLGVLPPAWGARDVRVTGSDLLGAAFSRALAEHARQSAIAVEQDFRGTRPGLEKLAAGTADVGLIMLPPGEVPAFDGLTARVIGYQPVVIVAPEAAAVTQVTFPQLRALFGTGAIESIKTWGELGVRGEDRSRPVELHALAPTHGLTLPLFRRLLLNDGPVRGDVKLADSAVALEQALRGATHALGLSPALPAAGSGLRALAVATSVSDPATLPTEENLHQGSYALRLPLYVVFRREAAPELLPFLRFLLSDECAGTLQQAHFLPLPVTARNQLVFEIEEMR
jgi:phosphate transport system substrate-binding protein